MSMTNERINTGYAALQTDSDDVPVQVSGVALGDGDITHGGSGKKTLWPGETLRDAPLRGSDEALEGQPIATDTDHTADAPQAQTPSEAVRGEIDWAGFKEDVGVLYEGEVDDPDIARSVENGRLEVSPLVSREIEPLEGEVAEKYEDLGYDVDEADYVATEISKWRDIATVVSGASSSNEITVGGNPMKAEALHEYVSGVKDETVSSTSSTNQGGAVSGVEALKEVAGVEFTDTATGELDESEIPSDDYRSHYLYPSDTKSESSYPVVDAEGNLRRSNVDAAWGLGARGGVDAEELDSRLMELAQEFENPPEWAEGDDESMGAQVEDPAHWEACSLSVPMSGVSPQGDDGPHGDMGQSTADATVQDTTMTDLTDSEKRVLEAADSVEDPIEALEQYAAADGQAMIVEQTEYEAMQENVESVRGVMEEALCERTDLKESTVGALDFEALRAEFETEDGDLDAEALVQNPETGDPGAGDAEALSDETLAEARNLKEDIEALGDAAPEALKEDLAEMVDEENYADAMEVL